MFSKLQYISRGATSKEQLAHIQQALDADCKWIQLRFKNAEADQLTNLAARVKKMCADYGSTFIVNDHPRIAKAVDADGVHLGLTDGDVQEAKKIMGTGKIIGGTANTIEHVLQRVKEGCSYIGLGPLHFTATKENLSPILGFQGYKIIMDELAKRQIQFPVYAIGGIGLDDIAVLTRTGVYGVAVSGAISHHPDKKLLLQQFNTLLYESVNHSE